MYNARLLTVTLLHFWHNQMPLAEPDEHDLNTLMSVILCE